MRAGSGGERVGTSDEIDPAAAGQRSGRFDVHHKVVYCVVPRELAPELHDVLRAHWRDDDSVVVVVERRSSQRRQAKRRRAQGTDPERIERRAKPDPAGRRTGERRAIPAPAAPVELPDIAAEHAEQLRFVEVFQPRGPVAEDRETNELVARIQTGDMPAFDLLYLRYFDRVYAYARVALRDAHEAEDVAQQVFANVISALGRYEVREDTPFRSWLFRITRNVVLRTLERSGRLQPEEPAELDRRLESPTPEAPPGLDWLSDHDLARLVERLPMSQRQVILLRYVFELTTAEIAATLERTPVAVRMLEHRAMRALESRLATLRGAPSRCDRSPMVMRLRPLPVLTSRGQALQACGVALA
jgi:RNA polymerase sigma-70 factor, ECF subfamily